MGCTGPAKQRHVRGPEDRPEWIDVCPARFVGSDAIDMVEDLRLAGMQVSLTEQDQLPGPYLEACHYVTGEMNLLQVESIPKTPPPDPGGMKLRG